MSRDDVHCYELDSSSGDKTLSIPSSTEQGVRLRGVLACNSAGGGTSDTTDRKVEFKDKDTSSVLFTIYLREIGAGDKVNMVFTNITLPGMGIRFPSGIESAVESDYCRRMVVFYSGSSTAGDGS